MTRLCTTSTETRRTIGRRTFRYWIGEKIDPILIRKYGIYPTYHARIVYLMMQRALDGDHTMLFALFSLSSYDNLVPQLIDETRAAEKES